MSSSAAKILVVDDLPENANLLSRHLCRKGCDVRMAATAQDALEAIRTDDPEIVLLDLKAHHLDGFDVIRRVRADPAARQPPIIAISPRQDTEAITRALELGANEYVTTPLDLNLVWARVERQINQKRSTQLVREVNARLLTRLGALNQHRRASADARSVQADALMRGAMEAFRRGDLQTRLNKEVRSRLHAVLNVTQQMQSHGPETDDPAELKKALRSIEKSSFGLLTIFEDLTDFVTLQQSLPEPADISINVREAVLHEWEVLGGQCDTSAASFELFTDDPHRTVEGSPYYVRKAIMAVLSNAVRFTDRAPVIKVRLSAYSREYYRIAVEDNGVGIPADQRLNAIAPFRQIDGPTRRKTPGLGLGLAIANAIMLLHNGKLTLDDAPSGRGTRAELYFPYRQLRAPVRN